MWRNNASRVASRMQLWGGFTYRRCIHTTKYNWSIKPYLMPAMSPTMDKGGIVYWKVKPGATFQSGDVILEIETDKAQIDVEAQDEGVLVKILRGNGAKDIPVGATIAFTAEVEDDLSAVNIDELVAKNAPEKTATTTAETSKPEPNKVKKVDTSKVVPPVKKSVATDNSLQQDANKSQVLLPSVGILLAENGISKEDALNKIKATGNNGTILKGDVLVYLGKIPEESIVGITKYVSDSTHLDLSNIEASVLTPQETSVTIDVKDTSSTNVGKKKLEPLVVEESIFIDAPVNVPFDRLHSSVRSFLQEAYQYSHESTTTEVQSDYFDPVFEELITPQPRSSRFDYSFKLMPLESEKYIEKQNNDIFNILTGSSNKSELKSSESPAESRRGYVINLEISVNDKFSDSKEKTNQFLDYVMELEDIQHM